MIMAYATSYRWHAAFSLRYEKFILASPKRAEKQGRRGLQQRREALELLGKKPLIRLPRNTFGTPKEFL
jgi:hypothetical protein